MATLVHGNKLKRAETQREMNTQNKMEMKKVNNSVMTSGNTKML